MKNRISASILAFEALQLERQKGNEDAIVVVAHADDEAYFGAQFLTTKPRALVVVVTYSNSWRWFISKLSTILRGGRLVYIGLDDSKHGFDSVSQQRLETSLRQIVDLAKTGAEILTHGELGEYGHIQHRQIHLQIKNILRETNSKRLLLTPELREEPGRISVGMKAALLLYGNLTNFSAQGRLSNIMHANRAKYFNLNSRNRKTKLGEFQWANSANFHSAHNKSIREGIDYIKKIAPTYLELPDRRFLVEKLFPSFEGKVLNIGLHAHNALDYKFLNPAKSTYYSLDIDPQAVEFAKDGKHFTADITKDISNLPFFNHIVLMGVLGWAPGLKNKEIHVIENLTSKLKSGGTLTLGIHVGGAKWLPTRYKILRKIKWQKLVADPRVSKDFACISYVAGHNLIFVLRRIS